MSSPEQLADRAVDTVALSGFAVWLANGETLAIILSALAATGYYASKAVIVWLDRRDRAKGK